MVYIRYNTRYKDGVGEADQCTAKGLGVNLLRLKGRTTTQVHYFL